MLDRTPLAEERLTEDAARAALEALHGDAWAWALSLTRGDRERALEALQESYLKILDGRARHRGDAAFKTFLFGVIRLTARGARRRAWLRDLLTVPIDDAHGLAGQPTQETCAAAAQARAAFDALSPRQRAVAELVLTHDFTVAEAAEALGLSRGAASRHYAEAKTRLRARLGVVAASPAEPAPTDDTP